MNYSVYNFNLDLAAIGSQAYLTMKQGDTGRSLFITLSNKGEPYEIADGCIAVFSAKKPDGNIVFNNCTIENNVIHYKVTAQTTTAVGELDCEIRLYSGDSLITSPRFTALVNPAVYPDNEIIESVTEVTTLTGLIGEANALINDINAKLDSGDFVPKFSVGTVTTLPAGSNATVEITGTGTEPVFNFGIPQGDKGQAESLIPDSALSLESTKPVQNKVITGKVNAIDESIETLAETTEEKIEELDNAKVDKEPGKALSTNDFTNEYKAKLDGIEAGATKLEDRDVTSAKLADDAKSKGVSVSLTVAGWSSLTQTVSVSGVTASNNIIVAAAPDSRAAWNDAEVYCSAQAAGKLTFKCTTTPTVALTANVIILV
jgi:hypothetical protein